MPLRCRQSRLSRWEGPWRTWIMKVLTDTDKWRKHEQWFQIPTLVVKISSCCQRPALFFGAITGILLSRAGGGHGGQTHSALRTLVSDWVHCLDWDSVAAVKCFESWANSANAQTHGLWCCRSLLLSALGLWRGQCYATAWAAWWDMQYLSVIISPWIILIFFLLSKTTCIVFVTKAAEIGLMNSFCLAGGL